MCPSTQKSHFWYESVKVTENENLYMAFFIVTTTEINKPTNLEVKRLPLIRERLDEFHSVGPEDRMQLV